MSYTTEQEAFWTGEFGDAYIERNVAESYGAANVALFGRILSRATDVESVIELGANVGMNLRALRTLLPAARLAGVEINPTAAARLRDWGQAEVHEGTILDFAPPEPMDLAFTKGVLIHVNPDHLARVYEALAASGRRWVLIAEYYNSTPVTVSYRGHSDRLFKRDFAGEFLDARPDFALVDYGFAYHRDPSFPQDDVTWFLMERRP